MLVVEGIHEINYDFVQSYLIEDRDRLTLMDTGVANHADAVLDLIESIGRKPGDLRQIVLTHGHVDHTGSAADLVERTGATVLAHGRDALVIRGDADLPAGPLRPRAAVRRAGGLARGARAAVPRRPGTGGG